MGLAIVTGGTLVNLSNNAANDRAAVYSPNGAKIAFMTNRDGNWEIYTANAADGLSPTRLTNDAGVDAVPDWSPDSLVDAMQTGRRIELRPEAAAAEIARLLERWPVVVDDVEKMDIDATLRTRVLAQLGAAATR